MNLNLNYRTNDPEVLRENFMKIRKAFADIPNSSSTDWSSLTGTPPPVSTFANDAGYLTSCLLYTSPSPRD